MKKKIVVKPDSTTPICFGMLTFLSLKMTPRRKNKIICWCSFLRSSVGRDNSNNTKRKRQLENRGSLTNHCSTVNWNNLWVLPKNQNSKIYVKKTGFFCFALWTYEVPSKWVFEIDFFFYEFIWFLNTRKCQSNHLSM